MARRVNDRHLAILRRLLDLGLTPGIDVLEAGCGPGSLSTLIAAVLDGEGTFLGIDLDSDLIAEASMRLQHWPNAWAGVSDAVTFTSERRFHLIALPDLIEHVPPAQRATMITGLAALLQPNGWMMIHTPNPLYLEWLKATSPHLLKPIDIPFHLDELAPMAEAAGLFVHRIDTYAVWDSNCDYQAIALRPIAAAAAFV